MNPLLIKVALNTVSVSKKREYRNSENKEQTFINKKLPTNLAENCTVKTIKDFKFKKSEDLNSAGNPQVSVVKEGTVDTIIRLNNKVPADSIGILNFASAHSPGGGFLNGSVAQEECLCYCSELYSQQLNQEYYEINKEKNKYYTDTMIISQTNFFKDSKYKFLNHPINVFVITCPAVNMRIAGNTQEAKEKMKDRMQKILEMFILAGKKNIVLGAYGCGVFKNDPIDIANNWKTLLYNKGYVKYFDSVTFSILGNKNYEPFAEILKSPSF